MGTVKVRNPLNQAVRTLVMDETSQKYVEITFRGKESKEIPEPLSALTEQQLLNGALQRLAATKTDPK